MAIAEALPRRLAWPQAKPVVVIACLLLASRAAAFLGMLVGKRFDVSQAAVVAATAYDGGWFRGVVLDGYARGGKPTNAVAFYPGYPLLSQALFRPLLALGRLFDPGLNGARGAGFWLLAAAMLMVANACLVAALWAMWSLYQPRLGTAATLTGVALFLGFPTSFFLSSAYSESPFIAATAFAFLAASQRRWLAAGLAAGIACLIRAPGVLLLLPLALAWLAGGRPRPLRTALAGLAVFAAGAAAYPTYIWLSFGDPALYLHVQAQGWNRRFSNPATALYWQARATWWAVTALAGQATPVRQVDAPAVLANTLAVVGAATALALGALVLPAWQLLWVVLQPLPALVGGGNGYLPDSLDRYLLAAFPAFFVLGWRLRRFPAVTAVLFVVSLAATVVLTRSLARGFFIA